MAKKPKSAEDPPVDPIAELTAAVKKLARKIDCLESAVFGTMDLVSRVADKVAPRPRELTPKEKADREKMLEELRYKLKSRTEQLWEDVRRREEGLRSLEHLKNNEPLKVITHELRKALQRVGITPNLDTSRLRKDE